MATNGRKKTKAEIEPDEEETAEIEAVRVEPDSPSYAELDYWYQRWGKPTEMEYKGTRYLALLDGEAIVFIREAERIKPDWLTGNSVAKLIP